MKSIEWIDRLITEKKLPSDRQAALMLGLTRGAISMHRVGTSKTLDDITAYKLEELLNLPHGQIVLDQHAEREKDPNVSAMWRKLASAVAMLVVTICLTGNSEKALADQAFKTNNKFTELYIMRNYGRHERCSELRKSAKDLVYPLAHVTDSASAPLSRIYAWREVIMATQPPSNIFRRDSTPIPCLKINRWHRFN